MLNELIFFILPLLLSAICHHFLIVQFNVLPELAKPLDFNLSIKGQRLFGKSKTWRGLVAFVLLNACFAGIVNLFAHIDGISVSPVICGAILGFGYSLGELPNSFAKRQFGIDESQKASGAKGIFFNILDQTDSVIGALLALLFIYKPTIELFFSILIIGSLIHLIVDILLYQVGYKKKLKKTANHNRAD
jgi:hypothetical protein